MGLLYISVALLGLLAAALSLNVARMRGKLRISLGDGGNPQMLGAIRAHANFIEFVPLCLILIFVIMNFYGPREAGILTAILLVARLLHAGGLLGFFKFGRTIGAIGTIGVLFASSLQILFLGVTAAFF